MDLKSPTTRTFLLLGILTGLLMLLGYFISGVGGAIIFLLLSMIMNIGAFYFSDKIALSMANAKPVNESLAPEIYQDIRELSKIIGIPMPTVFYTNDAQPNAFATGRDPQNSSICITKGLLNTLNRNEVRAVLAHELSHIKNRDVLITTIAAVLAGAISSLANLAFYLRSPESERNRSFFAELLVMILTPIAATLIQLAVSRSREYQADESAAKFTGKPQDLAEALIKIDQVAKQIPYVDANPALSTLFIQNPFHGESILNLFSTHPPIEKRVERLMTMQK